MILTEEQARTKQCCAEITNKCSASNCMAWRWVDGMKEYDDPDGPLAIDCENKKATGVDDAGAPPVGVGKNWTVRPYRKIGKHERFAAWEQPTYPVGYCGLAGKPD